MKKFLNFLKIKKDDDALSEEEEKHQHQHP